MKIKDYLLKWLSLYGMIYTIIVCNSCKQKTVNYEPSYSNDSSTKKNLVLIVPTQTFYKTTDLFVNYLNDHLKGVRIQTVAGSSFSNYVELSDKGKFDLTISNGVKALELIQKGYSIIASVVEEHGYTGVIIVHRDSSINHLSDLKGKTIATPGPPALGSHMLQMLYMAKNGFDVTKDIKLMKLESLESVIINVYLGKCAAGFVFKNALYNMMKTRPELESKVSILLTTPEIVSNPLIIRSGLEKEMGDQLRQVLYSMHNNEEGRKALGKMGYLRFLPADSNSYRPVKSFLKEYKALVGDN